MVSIPLVKRRQNGTGLAHFPRLLPEVAVTRGESMQHMLSRGRSADQMFSLATLGAVTMLLYLSQTMSTCAEQLVALGQERAQVSDRTTTNTVAMPKESAPIRKSHKLIRKSAPVASVQLNDITTSSTTSTSLK